MDIIKGFFCVQLPGFEQSVRDGTCAPLMDNWLGVKRDNGFLQGKWPGNAMKCRIGKYRIC